jgi:predicted dehydrogenase
VGIHILDFASFAAGQTVSEMACQLATFDKAPGGRIGDYVLDANDSAVMQLRLAGGALGVVHATRLATGHLNDLRLRLYGDLGGLEVEFEGGVSRLRACLGDARLRAEWVEVDCPAVPTVYQRFIAAIRGEGEMIPDFARAADLQAMLDRAEESAARGGVALPI